MVPLPVSDLIHLASLSKPAAVCVCTALTTAYVLPALVRAFAAVVAILSRDESRAKRALKVLDSTSSRRLGASQPKSGSDGGI